MLRIGHCLGVATTRPADRLSQSDPSTGSGQDLVVKTLDDPRVLELVLKGRRKKA